MGAAIADYYNRAKAGRLRVFSFDEDEIPATIEFHGLEQMPVIEQTALQMAEARILM